MKKSAVVLLVLGAALLVFAFTVPPFITGNLRTIAPDLEWELESWSPQGFEKSEFISTAPTELIDEIQVSAQQVYRDEQGTELTNINDELILIGHSRFPAFSPTATITGTPIESFNEIREGLQYFFPANTQRQSYPYFDQFLHKTIPVDYAGRENSTYIFRHSIAKSPLADSTNYSVDRTLYVDRHSGLILDTQETIKLESSTGEQVIEFSFTDITRAEMEAQAAEITHGLFTARILDFFSKFLGLVFIAAGFWRTGLFATRK